MTMKMMMMTMIVTGQSHSNTSQMSNRDRMIGLRLKKGKAVYANQQITIRIDLEEITVLGVEPKTAANKHIQSL